MAPTRTRLEGMDVVQTKETDDKMSELTRGQRVRGKLVFQVERYTAFDVDVGCGMDRSDVLRAMTAMMLSSVHVSGRAVESRIYRLSKYRLHLALLRQLGEVERRELAALWRLSVLTVGRRRHVPVACQRVSQMALFIGGRTVAVPQGQSPG